MRSGTRRGLLISTIISVVSRAEAQPSLDSRPVRVLVGFPPGGAADSLARLVAQGMSERLKRSFFVENRAGAAGTLAASIAAQSTDGYTLLFGSPTAFTIAPALGDVPIKYSPVDGFDAVGMVCSYPLVLILRRELGVISLKELVTQLRAGSLKLSVGSFGIASTAGLATELFRGDFADAVLHVPFNGGAAAVQALLGGTVDAVFDTPITAMPLIQSGKVMPLAVTSRGKSTLFPELPSLSEVIPNLEVDSWNALFAPAGFDPELLRTLRIALRELTRDADFERKLRLLGTEPSNIPPEAVRSLVVGEIERYRKVRRAGR